MQKDFHHSQGQNHYNQPQMIYNNPQAMPGQMQMYAMRNPAAGPQPRPMNHVPRITYPFVSNNYNQQTSDQVISSPAYQGYVQQQTPYFPNGQPFYPHGQIHRFPSPQQFVVVQGQSQYSQYVPSPSAHTHPASNPRQIVYSPAIGSTSHSQHYGQHSPMPPVQQQQQQHPTIEAPQQKKRAAIRLTDPTTGKDLTEEVLKSKEKTSSHRPGSMTHNVKEDATKAKANANFAALVLQAKTEKDTTIDKKQTDQIPQNETKAPIKSVDTTNSSSEQVVAATSEIKESDKNFEKNIETVEQTNSSVATKDNKEEIPTREVELSKKSEDLLNVASNEQGKVLDSSTQNSSKLYDNTQSDAEEGPVSDTITESSNDEKSVKDLKNLNDSPKSTENESKVVEVKTEEEEVIVPEKEDQTETAMNLNEIKNSTGTFPSVEPIQTSDEPSKQSSSAFNQVRPKKKSKQRLKDIDSKDRDDNDMLSAYKDVPEKEEIKETVKEVEKKVEEDILAEDATWEDKEKSIEKEVIRNEDAEEPEVLPKTTQTKIIKSEDQNQINAEEDKLQYDREFLLKFQFAPICVSKPAGLPDMDIVLDQAHAPTKALVPGQRLSTSNDFMPTFMRSHSGGGKSSAGNRRGGRGGPPSQHKSQKILPAPTFEKIELKKSENAWVRPSEKAKDMTEKEREMDEVQRSVRSILNKLTPQKFKELTSQMLQLKVNSKEKLELTCDLIFEKALLEPNFCVPYAQMCRVLTESFKVNVPQGEGRQPQVITFRKILLNKCQKEFEKENTDEKTLEEDRNKTFETELERKAWKEELDYREMKNRRRMLGNIRFIGELFKFQMISENIMHDCILKLLRTEKQDSLEDNFECLCKLLSTIGKDLDHQQAKKRIDQYFTQIHKIIEKKKISSRIKFALQDVIDLRKTGWVPRRDEGNPKTIDQIHKEAEQKAKEMEMLRQQDKIQKRMDTRSGRGGGRDSPVVRGLGTSQGSDGWQSVTKGNRSLASAPVDPNRFKISKKDTTEISLGPGGRPGLWSKGASGGSSRSGSGNSTPTNEVEQQGNRFNALADSSVSASSFDSRKLSKGSGGGLRRGTSTPKKYDERASALRTVSDMTGGRSSRNQSPARSGSNPPSGRQTPSEGSQSPVCNVTEEKIKKVTKSTIDEYLGLRDTKEASLCIKELDAPSLHHLFVQEAISIVIEKKTEDRKAVGVLFHEMLQQSILTIAQLCKGVAAMSEMAPDFAVDVPLIYKYFGEIIGCIVYDGLLPLNNVKDTLEPLIEYSKAGLVMAEALSMAVQIAGEKESIATLWSKSGVTWDMLFRNNENVEEFIRDKEVEFTISQAKNHNTQMQEELTRVLEGKSIDEVLSYLKKLPNNNSPEFISTLTKIVCSSTIFEEKSTCRCNRELLKSRKAILERYVQGADLELAAVVALQQLSASLNHPIGLLKDFFEQLYEEEIISESSFEKWAASKEYPDGKGNALSSVKGFLDWLRHADEEEDSNTPPNNGAKK